MTDHQDDKCKPSLRQNAAATFGAANARLLECRTVMSGLHRDLLRIVRNAPVYLGPVKLDNDRNRVSITLYLKRANDAQIAEHKDKMTILLSAHGQVGSLFNYSIVTPGGYPRRNRPLAQEEGVDEDTFLRGAAWAVTRFVQDIAGRNYSAGQTRHAVRMRNG
jgi:hypothetical protein